MIEYKKDVVKEFKIVLVNEINCLEENHNKKLIELESTISMLQKQIITLKGITNAKCEENEQYGRRLCLRFDGIIKEKDETVERVVTDLKSKWKDVGIKNIPDAVVDRAHRIGKPYVNTETNVVT